jgi:hypothetical protein
MVQTFMAVLRYLGEHCHAMRQLRLRIPISHYLIIALIALMGTSLLRLQQAGASTISILTSGDPALRDDVAKSAKNWLNTAGFQVIDSPDDETTISRLTDCFLSNDIACGQGAFAKGARTDAMLFLMVGVSTNPKDGSRDIAIDGWFFEKGKDAKVQRRLCQRCRVPAMLAATNDLVTAIGATSAADSGRLRISSEPAGARIMVDGQPVGITPMEYQLPSGSHQVTVDKAGFASQSKTVDINRTDLSSVRINLIAESSATVLEKSAIAQKRPSRTVPKVLVYGGTAAIIVGTVLIGAQELRHKDPAPVQQKNEKYFGSTSVGAVVGGLGVVALGTGIYLWMRSGGETAPVVSRQTTTGLMMTPTVGGGVLGWTGSF